jgi:hypothetical protein
MQTLENRHLAIRDSTAPHGWRQPTQAESKELNENDPEGFFKNDVDYINKNAPWTEKAGIIKEDGTELTPAQAMAIYYGQTGAYNKLGLQNSDANNPTTKQDIMEYGANNDKRGQKPAGGLPNAQGTTSVDDLYKQALLQRMKKYNESEADARKVVDRELQGLRAKGMDDIAALSQMTGKTVSGGGRGLSIGTSKTVDPYTKQAIKKISEGKGSTLDYNTKQNAVNNFVNDKSELDITKFKEETNDKMSLQEAAKTVGEAPVVAGFKGYVNDMKNDEEINKEDYQEMSNLDKEKTREAMREAYGCTGED